MKREETERLRQLMRSLTRKSPPPELNTRLRVLASQERLRRVRRANAGALATDFVERLRLMADNLMRPVAVPAAGGLLSAIVLFSMLVPTFAIQRIDSASDVPTSLATEATLRSSISMSLSDEELVVDVLIDGHGRVVDYSVPRGQKWAGDPVLVRELENTLLMTRFAPATLFGQPASGRTRITLRRSSLDVRG